MYRSSLYSASGLLDVLCPCPYVVHCGTLIRNARHSHRNKINRGHSNSKRQSIQNIRTSKMNGPTKRTFLHVAIARRVPPITPKLTFRSLSPQQRIISTRRPCLTGLSLCCSCYQELFQSRVSPPATHFHTVPS